MHRNLRKKLLNVATGVAVAAAAVVMFLPAAQAAPGAVTGNVNVRSGPGTNYAVLDVARRGETVDVQRCQGSWCYVVRPGADGWVSASYLSASGGRPVNPSQPGLSFGFTIGGPGGPNISIGVGNQPQPQPQRPPRPGPRPPVVDPFPVNAQVCFFDQPNRRGPSFCVDRGQSIGDLGSWTDRISSFSNQGGARVEVCSEAFFRNCRTYTTSANTLGEYDDYIASIRVR
jgi:uncharacterized protein YraI